jgi:hypothetical protein
MSSLPHGHGHAAKFYENEASLYRTVSRFLTEGLLGEQPAVIIATPEHERGIEDLLCASGIEVRDARRNGDLVVLDAEETLGAFMVEGHPDRRLFEEQLGGIIEQTLRGRGHVVLRAYGEMVDVLWKQGRPDAAIELEILWNQLAAKYDFSLLCGYSMGNFYKEPRRFQDVCEQHTLSSIRPRPRSRSTPGRPAAANRIRAGLAHHQAAHRDGVWHLPC